MKLRLIKWLRGKLRKLRKKKTADQQLPYLPSSRTRALTPAGSQQALHQPPSCLLFTRLPYEVRRCILLHAFGYRLLHLGLFLERADTPLGPRKRPSRDWQWWNAECDKPPMEAADVEKMGQIAFHEPKGTWDYVCRMMCHKYHPDDNPQVGAMGWLLSCRQAYEEGIGILYETNKFHFTCGGVLTDLPRLLLPHRLAAITSVQFEWPIEYFNESANAPMHEGSLDELRKFVPSVFPNLRQLYISFRKQAERFSEVHKLDDDHILDQLDQLASELGTTTKCTFALPHAAFGVARSKCKNINDFIREWRETQMDTAFVYEQIWRPVGGGQFFTVYPGSAYPDPPPPDKERGDGDDSGYWVVKGDFDVGAWTLGCFMPT